MGCNSQGYQEEAVAITAAVAKTKALEQCRAGVRGGVQEGFRVGSTEERVD